MVATMKETRVANMLGPMLGGVPRTPAGSGPHTEPRTRPGLCPARRLAGQARPKHPESWARVLLCSAPHLPHGLGQSSLLKVTRLVQRPSSDCPNPVLITPTLAHSSGRGGLPSHLWGEPPWAGWERRHRGRRSLGGNIRWGGRGAHLHTLPSPHGWHGACGHLAPPS